LSGKQPIVISADNGSNPNSEMPVATVPRWRWWIHLLVIGGYFLPGIAFSFRHVRQGAALTSNARGLLSVSAINLAVFGLVFAVGWFASRATREQMFLRWRPGWMVVPLGIGYSIAIRIVVAIATLAVVAVLLLTHVVTQDSLQHFKPTKFVDVEKLVDKSAMQNHGAYFWLTLTVVSFIVAGLREELWRAGTLAAMRTLWPRAFGTRSGEIVAVVIIALVFGIAHISMGILAAAIAALLGVMLGLIILLHRSVWPAVLAHGFFDALSLALLPLVLQKLQQAI